MTNKIERIELNLGSRPRDTLDDSVNDPNHKRNSTAESSPFIEKDLGNGKKLYLISGE